MAVGHTDDACVGMSRKDGLHVGRINFLEIFFIAIRPQHLLSVHFCSNVTKEQANISIVHGFVTREVGDAIKHRRIVAIKRQTFQTFCSCLPRGVAGEQTDERNIERLCGRYFYGNYSPGLHIFGELPCSIAHISTNISDVPRLGFAIYVIPFAGKRLLSFVIFVIAQHTDVYSHIFEHLGHKAVSACGIVEETATEIVARRDSDIVGIDFFERV